VQTSGTEGGHWTAWGVARHFGEHHQHEKSLEDSWMGNLGTVLGPRGLNRKNEVLWDNRQNFGHRLVVLCVAILGETFSYNWPRIMS
jgi:hypothetical protein